MYLESIKLFNFRLFRHELLTDRFSPGLNIFVGPNGSGKSSFFNSIYLLIYGKLFDIEKELFKSNFLLSKQNNFLLIQIHLNNSEKLLSINKDKIVIKRLITNKSDKIWLSGHSIETKKFNEFLDLNGIYLNSFFFFLSQKHQLNFKNLNKSKGFEFLKKHSNFLDFSKNKTKILFLLKKIFMIKKKLLKLIQISVLNKNNKLRENPKAIQRIKLNFFFHLLENKILECEKKFLYKLKKNFFFNFFRFQKKIIVSRNKFDFIGKILCQLVYTQTFNLDFRKKKKFFSFKKICILGKDKLRFLIEIEKKISIVQPTFLTFSWNRIIKNQLKLNVFNNLINFSLIKKKYFLFKKYIRNFNSPFCSGFKFTLNDQYKKIKSNIFFVEYFSSKDYNLGFNSNVEFLHKIFINRQQGLRFLDQFFYEINFVKETLKNREKNLCKFFGPEISTSIRFLSEIVKNNHKYSNKVHGILLDLIIVYKYFEKPVEAFLWKMFPSIVLDDENIFVDVTTELKKYKKVRLNFILNQKKKKYFNLKNPKMINFESFVFSNSKISSIVKNLIGNTFLCNEPNLASKLSKNFSVTIVTLDGQIFYSNGLVSNTFIKSNYSILHESTTLKRERNFLRWMLDSISVVRLCEQKLNITYKKQKKFNLIRFEINQFFLFKKKKSAFFLEEINFKKYDNSTSTRYLSNFLIQLDLYTKNLKKIKKKSIKFLTQQGSKQKIIDIKKMQIQRFTDELFLSILFSKVFENSFLYDKNIQLSVKYLKTNNNINLFPEIKNMDEELLLNKFISQFSRNITSFKKKEYRNFLFFRKHSCFYKKTMNEVKLITIQRPYWVKISNLKFKLSYLNKIKKKILKFYSQKNINNKAVENFFVFKLTIFHENLENNLNILYQMFNNFTEKKVIEFKKISKLFSAIFQENLVSVFTGANSCIIWKERQIKKKFKNELLKKCIYIGFRILIKFSSEEPFNFIENMSKGQQSFSLLIFCFSLLIISKKRICFVDELDINMDFQCKKLSSKLFKKYSSKGYQFFVITHKREIIYVGDKWYGVSISKKGSLVENISFSDSKKFLTISLFN